MDQRRKKAVILAALPCTLGAGFMAVMPRVSGNPLFEVLFGLWLVLMIVCLAFSMREIISLKRDGNPY